MDMMPANYRAVFFDLDGTLLPMELDEFMGSYFKSLGAFVAKAGLDTASFSKGLKAGTAAMAVHEDGRTNAEAYWEAFCSCVEGDAATWEPLLEEYYEQDFGRIGDAVEPNPHAARALNALAQKGYPLLLTTMPMFPRRAVEWRLTWAGVDPALFSRITTYENSTSVKPKVAYCAENVAACGVEGADVLMVGNNTVEDLSFTKLGADAYLVTDHLLDPVQFDLSKVKHSTMEEFADWAEALPVCANPASGVECGVVDAAETRRVIARDLLADEAEQAADLKASIALNTAAVGDAAAAARLEGGE